MRVFGFWTVGFHPATVVLVFASVLTFHSAAKAEMTCVDVFSSAQAIADRVLEQAAIAEQRFSHQLSTTSDPKKTETLTHAVQSLDALIAQLLDVDTDASHAKVAIIEIQARIQNLMIAINTPLNDQYRPDISVHLVEPAQFHNRIELRKSAQRQLESLHTNLAEKATAALLLLNNVQKFTELPRGLRLERLNMTEFPQFKNDLYSIRINIEYRITFAQNADGSIIVYDISRTFTHGGH